MTTDAERALEIARRLTAENTTVQRIFEAELANEEVMRREAMSKQRDDEMPPAANLSSTIDSIRQGLPIAVDGTSEQEIEALVALLGIRDLLPGEYEIRNLLPDEEFESPSEYRARAFKEGLILGQHDDHKETCPVFHGDIPPGQPLVCTC